MWGGSSGVERMLRMYEVPGSIPGISTDFDNLFSFPDKLGEILCDQSLLSFSINELEIYPLCLTTVNNNPDITVVRDWPNGGLARL